MDNTENKLSKWENLVEDILIRKPSTRTDDMILYLEVIKETNYDALSYSLFKALSMHKVIGLPNIKTIERVRRKVKNKYPDLFNPEVEKARIDEVEEYQEYARS